MKIRILPLLIAGLAFGCEKVVDVKLKNSEPRIIIDADISNQPGPYLVKLSKTVDYNNSNEFPHVSGAIIKISDDAGNVDTLKETSPGVYQMLTIQGVPGRQYYLMVQTEDKTFNATSTMPFPVELDSLSISEENIFGESEKNINIHFTDPAGIKNYYRFVASIDGIPFKAHASDDKLYDGKPVAISIEPEETSEFTAIKPGDKIEVEMQAIDVGVFKFFLSLAPYLDNGPPAVPANPITNIGNNGLGYFSAHSTSKINLIVK